jgi:hypothetical protein
VAGVLHAVDSVSIAERLDRAASSAAKRLSVYVEVNTGGEQTKAGLAPERTPALVARLRELPALELLGLMSIPPPGGTRQHFIALRGLARELGLTGLSMGMTDDFEAAVEEGATVVRVGTALFGRRPAA